MSIFPVASDSVTLDTAQVETTDVWANGFRINPVTGGVRAAFSNTVSTYNQGIPLDSNGVVCLVDSTASFPSATWSNGIPLSNQKMCLSSAAASTYSNGLPMASNGGVGGLLVPSMSLYFLGTASLDSRITFARADAVTCATYFDSTGRLQLMGRNELTYSSTFTNAAWTKTDVTPTLGESSPLDVGYLMTEGSAGTSVTLRSCTVAAGSTITVSIVAKRGNTDWFRLQAAGVAGTDGADAWFNLNTGAKGSVVARGAGTSNSSTITSLGGGWYRCTVTTLPNGTYTDGRIAFLAASADASTARVSGATYTVSAAQLERGSTATTYSATTTAENSGPRFDYDPASPAGVTGPELVTNGDFSQGTTGWTLAASFNAGTLSVSNGQLLGVASSTTGLRSSSPITVTLGKTYTISGRLAGTGSGVTFRVSTAASLGSATYQSATITTQQDVSSTFVATATTMYVGVAMATTCSVNDTFTIDNISVQEVTFNPRGLLIEESRQNLLLQSRDMTQAAWVKDFSTAARNQVGIDGASNTACKITPDTSSNIHRVSQVATIVTTTAYTYSVVAKAAGYNFLYINGAAGPNAGQVCFNLSTGTIAATTNGTGTITSLGGGWYRCSVTATSAGTAFQGYLQVNNSGVATDTTFVGDGTSGIIVDCAQLEVGAFATSIIPTTTTALTRAADSASMTGTNFSSWYNTSAGTFVAEWDSALGNVNTAVIGTSSGLSSIQYINSGSLKSYNGAVILTTANTASANTAVKSAVAYDGSGRAACLSAGTVATSTPPFTDVAITSISLGTDVIGSKPLAGHIRSLRYYPTRLPNATLQALTA